MVECGFILYGDIKDLEDIKKHIIREYNHITLVRSILTKERLVLAEKFRNGTFIYSYDERKLHKKFDNVYFAFLLYGQREFIKKLKEYIDESPVDLCLFFYSGDRMYIVKKSLWDDYKNEKIENEDTEEYKEKYKVFLSVKEEEDNEG